MVKKVDASDAHKLSLSSSISQISGQVPLQSPQLLSKHVRNFATAGRTTTTSSTSTSSFTAAPASASHRRRPSSPYRERPVSSTGSANRPPTCPTLYIAQTTAAHSFSFPVNAVASPSSATVRQHHPPLLQVHQPESDSIDTGDSSTTDIATGPALRAVAAGCLTMSAQQLYSLYHLGHQAHHAQQQTIRETSMGNGAPTDQSKLQALLEQPGTGDDDDQRSVCTGIYNPQVTSSKFSDGVRPIDFVLVYNANWRHTKPSLDSDGHVIGPPTMRTPLTESSPLSNDLKSTEDGDVVQKTSLPSPMPVTSGQFLQVVQIEASTSSGGNRNAWSARTMRGSMLLSGFGATMPKDQPSNRERHLAHCCRTFEENLLSEGLQLEYASADFVSTDSQRLAFVKIHAPWEILCRYAEVMKLKMPMKQIEASWRMIFDQDDPYSKGRFTAPYSRDKEYLFDVPADRRLFFTSAQRAQIVEFILKRKSFSTNLNDASAFGINKLLQDGAYLAAYPLHEGVLESPGSGRAAAVIGLSAAGTALGSTSADRLSAPQRRLLDENEHSTRIRLLNNWASLRRVFSRQPLDEIRAYFGVKIALYFAWLGFYTSMLIPASAVGLLCFLYGVFTLDLDVPIKQVCNKTFDEVPMCPLCNIKACDFWYMSDTCTYSKVSYLFDNPATMCFAVFMSLWATVYLEMWKRYSSRITYRWDLSTFDAFEEYPRPEYLARLTKAEKKKLNVITRMYEPYVPFWKKQLPYTILSSSVVLLLILLALASVLGVIVYRVSVRAALANNDDLVKYSSLLTSSTAALLNLLCILIFNQIYGSIALYLTELEMPRTQTDFDNSLTLKMYLLQFVNYYSSIFYIAFFKGRFVSHPGEIENNNRFTSITQEECGTGGCLVELAIQLAIIMVGKQALNAVFEMVSPWLEWLMRYWRVRKADGAQSARAAFLLMPQCEADYLLAYWRPQALFYEYLEMVLQFGFVTIFVAAFPLAPLFALINNALEIRLDARKMITSLRRPVAQRVKNIGIWYRILDAIGKLSVVTNGVIIAFTSDFIPRLFHYTKYGSLNTYLNHTLSYFDAAEINTGNKDEFYSNTTKPHYCLYQGHRNPPDSNERYMPTQTHWEVLALKLGFVVLFENVITTISILIRWLIPDVPRALRQQMRQHAYLTNELIMQQELKRAKEGLAGNQ